VVSRIDAQYFDHAFKKCRGACLTERHSMFDRYFSDVVTHPFHHLVRLEPARLVTDLQNLVAVLLERVPSAATRTCPNLLFSALRFAISVS
jgi:hypothetical protein